MLPVILTGFLNYKDILFTFTNPIKHLKFHYGVFFQVIFCLPACYCGERVYWFYAAYRGCRGFYGTAEQ